MTARSLHRPAERRANKLARKAQRSAADVIWNRDVCGSAPLLSIALCSVVMATCVLSGQAANKTRWVLVAATSGYASELYTIGSTSALTPLRELVSLQNGTYMVEDTEGDALSVAYPVNNPTTLNIVHKSEPMRSDLVEINPEAKFPYPTLNTIVRNDSGLSQLMTVWAAAGSPLPVLTLSARLIPDTAPRVAQVSPDAYRNFDAYGLPGGPGLFGNTLNMNLTGTQFTLRVGSATVNVMPAPSDFKRTDVTYPIMAANTAYVVTDQGFTRQEVSAAITSNSVDHVYHLSNHTWTNVPIEGSVSRQRIHGNWLTVIVQYWCPGNTTNPGRDLEREFERWSNLPGVRDMYEGYMGSFNQIPGKLQLINLADGRRFEIKTGMEDSEILTVTPGEQVLYRVNDSIYECAIESKTLSKPTLLVKDPDTVPEVHWAFLSDAASLPPIVQ